MAIHQDKITKQKCSRILFSQEIIAMLTCFYFCTALDACTKNLYVPAHLKKGSLPYKTPDDRSNQLVSKDYNDNDRCLYKVEQALQGDTTAMDFLVARGKAIDAKGPYEPGSIKIAMLKNSKGDLSLILEYARKGILSGIKQSDKEPITLMVASSEDSTGLPPYYQEATKESLYITLIKRLIKYKLDLNSQNTKGETLLTEVITNGSSQNQIALLTLLLKAGANPNGLNRKQKTPLGLISQVKNSDDRKKIVKLLMGYGGNPLLAQMDKDTQEYVREVVIGQLEKIHLTLASPSCSAALTQADAKLPLFFAQKYNGSNAALSGKQGLPCVVCKKKEPTPTTIQIPSCGHYVHGSCLVRLLLTDKCKKDIKLIPSPSYLYRHPCPCCKKDIADTFIKDLNTFYEDIKFEHKGLTIALQVAFAILCLTILPGGWALLATLLSSKIYSICSG